MDVFFNNFSWMSFNLFLAFLGIVFGWLFYYSRSRILSILFFILWVLFIPNTIYLITDLEHLYDQWGETSFFPTILLILQYLIVSLVGIVSFVMSMHPIDKIFSTLHLRKYPTIKIGIIILVNILIAFAIILGKFERTHSWYVFTQTPRVIDDIISVLTTPLLLSLVLLFAFVTNSVYFAFSKLIPIDMKQKRKK
jgi:uncharacterized membrane protein